MDIDNEGSHHYVVKERAKRGKKTGACDAVGGERIRCKICALPSRVCQCCSVARHGLLSFLMGLFPGRWWDVC